MKLKESLITYSFLILLLCMSNTCSPNYSRVIPATQAQVNLIKKGLKEGFTASNIYAIKSKGLIQVYFVACNLNGKARVDSHGASEAVAVWAMTGDSNAPGMTLSMNQIAQEFWSGRFDMETESNVSMTTEGAKIVEDFVVKKLFLK